MALISVGIDGSAGSQVALEWAVAEAGLRGCDLQIVHAWAQPTIAAYPYSVVESYEGLEAAASDLLERTCTGAEAVLGRPVRRYLSPGEPADALLSAAGDSDLVVVGTRGRGGFVGLLLGSVSNALAHHCPCPLAIIPTSHRT